MHLYIGDREQEHSWAGEVAKTAAFPNGITYLDFAHLTAKLAVIQQTHQATFTALIEPESHHFSIRHRTSQNTTSALYQRAPSATCRRRLTYRASSVPRRGERKGGGADVLLSTHAPVLSHRRGRAAGRGVYPPRGHDTAQVDGFTQTVAARLHKVTA